MSKRISWGETAENSRTFWTSCLCLWRTKEADKLIKYRKKQQSEQAEREVEIQTENEGEKRAY